MRVGAVAHKTCDVAYKTGGRRVHNALHLEGSRCDGSQHGGCQAGCLLFWKTDWIRQVEEGAPATSLSADASTADFDRLVAATSQGKPEDLVYSCQATRLYHATEPLPWWDFRQYVRDLRYGNVSLRRFLRVAFLRTLYCLRQLGIGYRLAVALHDAVHKLVTGKPTPYVTGVIPVGCPTPTQDLGLKQGEWVQVRPLEEIRRTLTEDNANRGMRFDKEMSPFCERTFKVAARIERIIDEKTGKMLTMKSSCIVLDGAVCSCRLQRASALCPRQIFPYFREIWLRRVP